MRLEEFRSGAGVGFVDQVEAILQIAGQHPATFPAVPGVGGNEVRRGLIRKYGYWVVYEIRPDNLLVLAVWHGARDPQGWRRE